MTRSIRRLVLGIIVSLAATSASRAANDVWDNTPVLPGDIRWENGTNWTDGTTPGNGDTATFNLPVATQVAFAATPAAIQALTVTAPVEFRSSGGAKTLLVTSASGGQDVTIGAAVLALGTSGNPMHLTVGDDLTVSGNALLRADFGSQVNTFDLFLATVNGGGNGIVVVDGTNSRLNVTNNISMGLFGNAATLTYQNNAQGTLTGSVTLANSSNPAAAATLNVVSSANLITGSLAVGTGSAAATGTINIHGTGSTLTQSGASILTVGTAAAGIGNINIGTSTTDGTLTTGTGTMTINATGTVTIDNFGTLDAKGDILINGGTLERLGGFINVASGRHVTIQNGGAMNLTDGDATDPNVTYTVTGAGSQMTGSILNLRQGATIEILSGATLSTHIRLDISDSGSGGGTLLVDGVGSSASSTSSTSAWGDTVGTASVTFSNGATGSFQGLDIAGTAGAGNVTAVVNVLSGADLNTGSNDLLLATAGGTTTSATLNLQGAGSTLTQTVNTPSTDLTVGHSASGAAMINIGTTVSGATLSTGAGALTIYATGAVTIGSATTTGTLNANGNVTIQGGLLQLNNSGSTFAQAAGKTMYVQNGGRATFSSEFSAPNNAFYSIRDANSKLETIGVDPEGQFNSLELSFGGQMNVSFGGLVSSAGFLNIGNGGNGTLSVDGNGSSAVSAADTWSHWGTDSGGANVTFTNNATGMFNGGISMAASPGTTANVNILSGADLTVGVLFLAFSSGETTSATLNVQGNGSTVTQIGASAMIAGHVTGESIAEIYIGTEASGAVFSTGTGTLTINKNSFIVIGDDDNTGTLNANGNISINGGKLYKLNSGSTFNMAGGKTMTIQNGGWFRFDGDFTTAANAIYNIHSSSLLETVYGSPIIGNGATVNVNGTLYSWGGDLSIGTVGNGTLSVDGSNSFVSARLAALWGANGATATVTFSNNALGSLYDANVDLAGDSDAGTTAIVSVQSGADLNVHNLSLATAGGATTSATLTVDGADSSVTQTEAATLTVGHSATGTARLVVKNNGVFTTGTGGVTVRSTGQINIESGGVFDAYGTINMNGGAFNFLGGTLHADTFNGNLLNQGGTLAPGHSVGSTTIVGNYTQQAGATLEIEIGGLSAGSGHDLLGVTGNAILGGELQLALIGAFVPAAANSFTVLNATGIFGVFSNVTTGQRLTTVDGIGSFLVHYGAGSVFNNNQIVLTAFELVALPGDFNPDGTVDAADYVVWRNNEGTTTSLPNDNDIGGTIGQAHYNLWRAHFGQSVSNGTISNATIPEPASGLLLILAAVGCGTQRRFAPRVP